MKLLALLSLLLLSDCLAVTVCIFKIAKAKSLEDYKAIEPFIGFTVSYLLISIIITLCLLYMYL